MTSGIPRNIKVVASGPAGYCKQPKPKKRKIAHSGPLSPLEFNTIVAMHNMNHGNDEIAVSLGRAEKDIVECLRQARLEKWPIR